MARVGDEAELEVLSLPERLVRGRRVVGNSDDLGAGSVELWGSITEPLTFNRSAGGVCDREPPKDGPSAAQVGVGEGLAILVGDSELGGGVAGVEHEGDSGAPG